MFERPIVLWLFVAAPLVIAPGLFAMIAGKRLAGAASACLRSLVFGALVLMAAGIRLPVRASARRMSVVVAVDQSRSISPDQRVWMARRIREIRGAMSLRDRLAVLGFGADARLVSPLADPRLASATVKTVVNPDGTDIADALTSAAGIFPREDEKRIVLLTDGNQTHGQVVDELPAMTGDGIRIFADAPPPSAASRVAITEFDAPELVRADAAFALRLSIDSEARSPAQVQINVSADGKPVGSQQVTLTPGINHFKLPYRVSKAGAYLMKAEIKVPHPLDAVNPVAETAVSAAGPPRVLVVSGNPPESLIQALRLRDYRIDTTAPRGLPVHPEDYLAYQAVIIANVPEEALSEGAQQALREYVADLGGGLIVTGDSLRDYKFHKSTLEKSLPVSFEPQPPPPSREPIAVYLLIDRSNSMSYNSRYPAVRDGERIRYAKEAAVALLNQLDDTDYAGVIAFDSEPYILSHLRALGEDRDELLNRVRRLEPGGGTDFKDALEISLREIISSGINVREVILLTDGDTNRQYHDHDQLMAEYAKAGIPVSTIRIGPDLENLRLLQDFAHATGGVFHRVEDITKLPQLLVHLTHEAQNFKMHQRSEIEVGHRSAILNGMSIADVPPIDFFAVTEPKDAAEVPLTIHKGARSAPLLATWQYELGRSAVFAADPDSLGSLAWIRWDRYAQFWSQLVSWVARDGDSGPFSLKARTTRDNSIDIDAEEAAPAPVSNLYCRITGPGRDTDVAMTQVGSTLYHGESAPLPRGKYALTLIIKAGDTEKALLRRDVAVPGSNASDDELRLKPPDTSLLRRIAEETGGQFDAPVAQMLRRMGVTVTTYRSIDPYLLPLAIFALLGEVFVRRRYLGD